MALFIFCLLICLGSSGCPPPKPEEPVFNLAFYHALYADDGRSIYACLSTSGTTGTDGEYFSAGAYSGEYSDCKQVEDDYICIKYIYVGYDWVDSIYYKETYYCIYESFNIHNICASDAILILTVEGNSFPLKVVCVDSCEETISEGIDINAFELSSEIIIDLDNYEKD